LSVRIFVHMHKSAGSTVVKKAKASGLKLAALQKNGNLLNAAGKTIRYREISEAATVELLTAQQKAGVEFMAMEADFPRFELLESLDPLILLTVLREPLSRAKSNYVYAKVRGNVDLETPFQTFLNKGFTKDGPLSRTSNYFVRKLTAATADEVLTEASLERAIAILEKFDAVAILGAHDLDAEMARVGLTATVTNAKQMSAGKLQHNIDPRHLTVSDEDAAWYLAHNTLDTRLVDHFRPA
jgi:hypothetical protein